MLVVAMVVVVVVMVMVVVVLVTRVVVIVGGVAEDRSVGGAKVAHTINVARVRWWDGWFSGRAFLDLADE